MDYIVSGIEQNHHNYTLSEDEIVLIEDYRALDGFGRELTRMVVAKEGERVQSSLTPEIEIKSAKTEKKTSTKILTPNFGEVRRTGIGKRSILLYDLPVSAGPGVYLDDETAEEIQVPDNEKTQAANFALRIRGNSMEPKYHDGDVLLVEDTDAVEVGELGVFILDGNGYFKKYGGDCLISLNPEYGNILLKEYAEAVCCGRVIGKLKKKVTV